MLNLPISGSMLRYVDDIYLGIPRTINEEEVRAKTRFAFQSYELEVNYEKTRTYTFRTPYDANWTDELAQLTPRGTATKKMIERFSLQIFDLIDRHPDSNVALYAAKLMMNIKYSDDAWCVAESILIRLTRENQTLVPVLGHIWTDRRFKGEAIRERAASKLLDDRLFSSIEARNFGETSWVLFLYKALKQKIDTRKIKQLFLEESAICALIICDLEKRGLVEGTVDKSHWNLFANADGLKSSMWLYAYEATSRGWSGKSDSYLSSDDFFEILHTNKIRFYGENKNFKVIDKANKISYIEQKIKKAISLNFEGYM